ncbi:hypothetical protein V6959_004637 [Vibrio parahaemolyticus]
MNKVFVSILLTCTSLFSFNLSATEFLYESNDQLVAIRGSSYISQVQLEQGTLQLQVRGGSLASGQVAVGIYTPFYCNSQGLNTGTIKVGYRDINVYESCNNNKKVWVSFSPRDDFEFQKSLMMGDTVKIQGVVFSTIGATDYILKYKR